MGYLKAAAIIGRTVGSLPAELVDDEGVEHVRGLVGLLPEALATAYCGYESSLSDSEQGADLAIKTPVFPSQVHALLQAGRGGVAPGWARYLEFLRGARGRNFFVESNIGYVWVGFGSGDLDLGVSLEGVEDVEGAIAQWLSLLGREVDRSLLRQCVEECRARDLLVTRCGCVLSKGRGIRLCIADFAKKPDLLGSFLESVGYEAKGGVVGLLNKLSPLITSASVEIELDEAVGPRLALACHPKELSLFERKKEWAALLDFLVQEGLCTEERREGALAWIGGFKGELYERELYRGVKDDRVSRSAYLWVVRELHHVKLIYDSRKALSLEAKIFLGVGSQSFPLEGAPDGVVPRAGGSVRAPFDLFAPFGLVRGARRIADYGKDLESVDGFYAISPGDCGAVSKILSIAFAHKIPVRIRGYGHSVNGSSLPAKSELLLSGEMLNRYAFEEEGAIVVEAGVKMWDLRTFLRSRGYLLTVCNGGYAAPSLGGYLSAGGLGYNKDDNAFWNIVEEVEFVTAEGRVVQCRRGDELFPWLFGSMGQLGFFTKAKIKIFPAESARDCYPQGERGAIVSSHPFPLQHCWFSLISPREKAAFGLLAVRRLEADYPDLWMAFEPFYLPCKYVNFNPPLLYPFSGDSVFVGVWGSPNSPKGFDRKKILKFERDFHKIVLSDPEFRRYVQVEVIPKNFDFRAYFGERIYARFLEIKRELDPLMLINRGVVFR